MRIISVLTFGDCGVYLGNILDIFCNLAKKSACYGFSDTGFNKDFQTLQYDRRGLHLLTLPMFFVFYDLGPFSAQGQCGTGKIKLKLFLSESNWPVGKPLWVLFL